MLMKAFIATTTLCMFMLFNNERKFYLYYIGNSESTFYYKILIQPEMNSCKIFLPCHSCRKHPR